MGGFEHANDLVHTIQACPSDFQLLAGRSGWEGGQLQREVDQRCWYVVAASNTLLLDCITGKYYLDWNAACIACHSMVCNFVLNKPVRGCASECLPAWSCSCQNT